MLPEELQYLGPEQQRETEVRVLREIVEAVWLVLARGGEEAVKEVKEKGGYAVLRELHLGCEDEGVREGCERCVQLLMGGEEGDGMEQTGGKTGDREGDSEDEKVVEIF